MTPLVVSRVVRDARPDRADLMCPTDLRRDGDGDVVTAGALAAHRPVDAGTPGHLVVLAGDPLPNLQAIATLRPARVTIVASPQTALTAATTRAAAATLAFRPSVAIVGVADANDKAAVVAALEAVEPGWALSYTGGTKVMAAHARLAYERLGDGRAAHASVIDGCVRFDDGHTLALADGEVTLRALALLHGHKLVGGIAPRVSPADLGRVRHLLGPRLTAVAAGRATLDWNDPELAGIPRTARRLLTTVGGTWLESLTGASAALVADEVVVNPRLRIAKRAEHAPELDVVVRSGWDVTLLSCTVDRNRSIRKLKLIEAQRRAQQLGGGRTIAGLVCLGTPGECESLAGDIGPFPGVDAPVLVFGRVDLLAWLNGDRRALRDLGRPRARPVRD